MKTSLATARVYSAALGAIILASAGCGSSPDESVDQSKSSVTSGARQGVDYSWGRPSPAGLRADGYTFAARYLSYDTSGKNLSAGEAHSLEAAGVDVVANWENDSTAALNGYSQGVSDARAAESQASADGMPAGRPIYFSIDFDASEGEQGAINSYFDGVASVIGRDRTGAYGGYYPIQRLFDAGKIQYAWQTYAWSGGQWDPRAQVRQVENGVTIAGGSCDIDQAVAADFGQWGYGGSSSGPTPPTKVCGSARALEPPLRSCSGSHGASPALPPKSTAAGALASGEGLGQGGEVSSPDGRFKLAMQTDGNVVLYSSGVALWNTGTFSQDGLIFVMQTDGNLVLYSNTSCALWASNTSGHPGATLALQNDGNIVVYDGGKALWASNTGGVPAAPTRCGAIDAGHGLAAGESVVSCDGRFELVLQSDSNLVLYSGGMALWSTGTNCQYGRALAMQGDGNLVLYSNTGAALWDTHTNGHPGATLAVQNDGNVVIYDGGKALWNSGTVVPGAPAKATACGLLKPGQGLEVGESHSSCDSRFTLAMQSDGNLVLYEGKKPLWETATNGKAGFGVYMQGDGNLVLYSTHSQPLWSSGTSGHSGSFAAIQTDGNFVVYDGSKALWNSGTEGH
jgi:hypothetical protein